MNVFPTYRAHDKRRSFLLIVQYKREYFKNNLRLKVHLIVPYGRITMKIVSNCCSEIACNNLAIAQKEDNRKTRNGPFDIVPLSAAAVGNNNVCDS